MKKLLVLVLLLVSLSGCSSTSKEQSVSQKDVFRMTNSITQLTQAVIQSIQFR